MSKTNNINNCFAPGGKVQSLPSLRNETPSIQITEQILSVVPYGDFERCKSYGNGFRNDFYPTNFPGLESQLARIYRYYINTPTLHCIIK